MSAYLAVRQHLKAKDASQIESDNLENPLVPLCRANVIMPRQKLKHCRLRVRASTNRYTRKTVDRTLRQQGNCMP